MGLIDQLTLSEASRNTQLSPTHRLRHKIAEAIDRQIASVRSDTGVGDDEALYEIQTATNPETGTLETIRKKRRLVKWYWQSTDGKLHLTVRYGHYAVPLKGSKTTIDVENFDQLVETLTTVRQAVMEGELDAQLKKASEQRKQVLKKAKSSSAGK